MAHTDNPQCIHNTHYRDFPQMVHAHGSSSVSARSQHARAGAMPLIATFFERPEYALRIQRPSQRQLQTSFL